MEVEIPHPRILIGLTGSVASIKASQLVQALLQLSSIKSAEQIRIVSTKSARHFFNEKLLPVQVYEDADEWSAWKKIGDPVLHIELRNWADIMVIAPLDANTLAKLANGICDNLLTCIVRAWDMSRPLLIAPAMNTHMWNHPLTARQLKITEDLGYREIPPIAKKLACGDIGVGAMAEPGDIAVVVNSYIDTITDLPHATSN